MSMYATDLFEVFLLEAWENLAALEAGIGELRSSPPSEGGDDHTRYTSLGLIAHRLRGSAGLYGYPQLAALSALGERMVESRPRLEPREREELLDVLELVTLGLRHALNEISSGRSEGEVGLHFAQIGGAAQLRKLLKTVPLAFQASSPQALYGGSDDASPVNAQASGADRKLHDFARQNGEVWSYFAPEIREYSGTLRSELDRGSQGNVTLMFRAAHTIKGSAFMVGLPVLGDLAHRLEDLLEGVREEGLSLEGMASTLLGQGVSLIEQVLLAAEGDQAPLGPVISHLQNRIGALLAGETLADEALAYQAPGTQAPGTQVKGTPQLNSVQNTLASQSVAPQNPASQSPTQRSPAQTIRVSTEQLDKIMDNVGQLVMSRARLDRQLGRLSQLEDSLKASHARVQRVVRDFEERYLNPDLARNTPEGSTPESGQAAGAGGGEQTGGVQGTGLQSTGLQSTVQDLFEELEFDSYDDMNILARSVTELSADLGELQGQFRQGSEAVRTETDTFSKLLRALRGDVARTRRVPLSQAYARPIRWARTQMQAGQTQAGQTQAGQMNQVQADLVTLGGDQDADAFVTQGLGEVLLHLVTNAYTHGLETTGEREKLGKPARGRVTIDARRRGNQLDVSVSDDGRGIDVQRVREQALARGLRSARELETLSDEAALRLIFLPGLSTASEVTNQAGRGVGMDIVASTVRRMGGELLVQSTPGQGSTFTLRVSLTQQVADLLTVRVGPYPLGFPAGSIVGLRELAVGEVLVGEGGHALLADGTPLYPLQPLWGLPNPLLANPLLADSASLLNVLLLSTAAGPVAFCVDDFGGIAEAVISAPSAVLGGLDYVSGTSVTPDGEPVLLPDPAGLARYAAQAAGQLAVGQGALIQGASAQEAYARDGHSDLARQAPAARRLLLIDDSLSVRRLVSRMLERSGYVVVTAADGQEAIDLLRTDTAFQAILTDLEMPRANGFEVIEEVRRRDPHLPIVVMTTRAGEKHQRLAFQLGASDYFSKPVDESLLTRCLERLLNEHTPRPPQ
jgi:chemosensory pili system protein ChpA (sensor histidine kinase/response regulator)